MPSYRGFRIATLNVRGIALRKKQCQLKRLLLEESIDILAVQETKLANDEVIGTAVEMFLADYEVSVSHAAGNSGGCFLFLKKSLPLSDLSVVTDGEGRFILNDFSLQSIPYRVICVYAPTKVAERKLFFRNIVPWLNTDKCVLLVGDFNCVCAARDRLGGRSYIDPSARLLEEVMEEFDLMDAATLPISAGSLSFTHFHRSSYARLDRIYISVTFCNRVTRYFVKPNSFSDHCLVVVELGGSGKKNVTLTGGYWNLMLGC